MPDRLPTLFILGLGYSCQRFIDLYGNRFSGISGTVRSEDKAQALQSRGIEAVPVSSGKAVELAEKADIVLVSVPPDETGDPVLPVFGKILAEAKRCRWLGYLSTTGVYGDRDGAWIDETAPLKPSSRNSRQRAEAEREWLAWGEDNGVPVQIFRLTGIYGPGRNAFVSLRRGAARRIVKEGQVFNRIHADDIAATLMASIRAPRAGGIYNVSDDEPAPPQDVIAYAARLAGIEPPPEEAFETADIGAVSRSFYGENKRICNRLIKEELGVKLSYPNYREGLAALMSQE